MKTNTIRWALPLLGIIFIALSLFYEGSIWRVDFSEDKKYSLHEESIDILKHKEHSFDIDILLTGTLPTAFERLKIELLNLLDQYKEQTNTNFNIKFIDPNVDIPDDQKEDFAKYCQQLNLKHLFANIKQDDGVFQKVIFPCIILHYKDMSVGVNLLENQPGMNPNLVVHQAMQNLEYLLSASFKKLLDGEKPLIAFTENHGELSNDELQSGFEALYTGYNILRADLSKIDSVSLKKVKLLAILNPTKPFSESDKKKLDYYVQNGGNLLITLDHLNLSFDDLYKKGEALANARDLNLNDLLFRYGVKINYDLIADMNCSSIPIRMAAELGDSEIQLRPFLFFPLWVPLGRSPIINNLNPIRSEFASSLELVKTKNKIRKTVFLNTSPYHFDVGIPNIVSLNVVDEIPPPDSIKKKTKPIGVLLEGRFPSHYHFINHKEKVGKPAKIVVISDGDIFKNYTNQTQKTAYPLGLDRYTFEYYANKDLLLNIVDYLNGERAFITLRNKKIIPRPLDLNKLKLEKKKWLALNGIVPILLVILLGFGFNYTLKKKCAK